MAAFVKFDGVKGFLKLDVVQRGNGFIKFDGVKDSGAGKMQQRLTEAGMSRNGADELAKGLALSDPEDRKLVAAIVGAVLA